MRVSIQDFKEQTIAIGFACRITWQHETFNVTWRYSTWEIMSWCRDGKVMGIGNWWKCHVFWAIAALDRISIRLWSVPLRSSDSGTAWQGRTAWDVFTSKRQKALCDAVSQLWASLAVNVLPEERRCTEVVCDSFAEIQFETGTRVSWSYTDINSINMYDFVLFMYLHNVRIPAEECRLISWLPHLNSGHPVGQKLHHTRFFAVCYSRTE